MSLPLVSYGFVNSFYAESPLYWESYSEETVTSCKLLTSVVTATRYKVIYFHVLFLLKKDIYLLVYHHISKKCS